VHAPDVVNLCWGLTKGGGMGNGNLGTKGAEKPRVMGSIYREISNDEWLDSSLMLSWVRG
jgi:hypothetical protein